MIKRRSLIKIGFLSFPVLFGGFNQSFHLALSKVSGFKDRVLAQLFIKYQNDKVDKNPAYLEEHDFTAWHREIHPYLKNLKSLNVPSGLVVELGVHRGQSSEVLKSVFGRNRYLGVDSHPFTNDPQVIRKDIRKMGPLLAKAAVIWNDISTWEGSPRSRLAALNWAKSNLKKNGIYIDEGSHKIPVDVDLSAFDLIHSGKNFTVFRKRV